MRAKVVDNKDLEKDMKTGAVINTNRSAYLEAVERANRAKEEKQRIELLEKEVSDIKQILNKILEKVS